MAIATPTILLVCTGNVCRSPAAQFLLVEHLGPASAQYSIHSAGIAAPVGAPIDPTIAGLLRGRGIEADPFAARRLEPDLLRAADLILTGSTNHRAAVVRMVPAAVRKTLTLKQLARYAPFILESGFGPTPVTERIPWILSAVPGARARAEWGDDSIADPSGKSRRRYGAAFAEVDEACATIAGLLRQPAPSTPATSPSWWEELSAPSTDIS